jgi:hypothetical protein
MVDTPRHNAPDARAVFQAIKAALVTPDGAAGDTFAAQAKRRPSLRGQLPSDTVALCQRQPD